jgi:hypothetical protein
MILTEAIGDVAWYIFKNNVMYGFIVSSDEIMFLRFDIDTCVEEVNLYHDRPELSPCMECVDIMEEPHLWYSDPIKLTDTFDSAEDGITVKLGLLHLLHEMVSTKWKMQDEKGRCAQYFRKTDAGERWVPKPPRAGP